MTNYRAGQHLRFTDRGDGGQVRVGTVAWIRRDVIVMAAGTGFTIPIKSGDVIAVLPCPCADHFTITCEDCGKDFCPRVTPVVERVLAQRFCSEKHRDRYSKKVAVAMRQLSA